MKKYIPEEKVVIVSSDEGKAPADEVKGDGPAEDLALKALQDDGIDTEKGKANCGGDEEFYRTILAEYLKGADEKKKDLDRFLEENDLKNYGILIHSLKSSSAMIYILKFAVAMSNSFDNVASYMAVSWESFKRIFTYVYAGIVICTLACFFPVLNIAAMVCLIILSFAAIAVSVWQIALILRSSQVMKQYANVVHV